MKKRQLSQLVKFVLNEIQKESTEPSIGGSFKDQQTVVGGTRDVNQLERDPLLDPQLTGKVPFIKERKNNKMDFYCPFCGVELVKIGMESNSGVFTPINTNNVHGSYTPSINVYECSKCKSILREQLNDSSPNIFTLYQSKKIGI